MAGRAGVSPTFVESLFGDPRPLAFGPESHCRREDYLSLMCTGGFPAVLQTRFGARRANWFASYVTTVAQRDVRELTRIRFAELLPKLLRLVAARTAQELKAAELARLLATGDDTVRNYRPCSGGRVAGIEVKLAQSVNVADFRHLRTMRDRLGDDFAAGVVFYSGSQRRSFGDRILALPVSALWDDAPVPWNP